MVWSWGQRPWWCLEGEGLRPAGAGSLGPQEVLECSLPAGSLGALGSQVDLFGLQSSEFLLCKMAE